MDPLEAIKPSNQGPDCQEPCQEPGQDGVDRRAVEAHAESACARRPTRGSDAAGPRFQGPMCPQLLAPGGDAIEAAAATAIAAAEAAATTTPPAAAAAIHTASAAPSVT